LFGKEVAEDDDLRQWLIGTGDTDVLIIGLQELVELRPLSVVRSPIGNPCRRAAFQLRVEAVIKSVGLKFESVGNFGMVGLGLLVYVRGPLAESVGEFRCDRIATGFGGIVGNKGCLSVTFHLGDLSFSILNVHLPSGEGPTATRKRDIHMKQILARASAGEATSCYAPFRKQSRNAHVTIVLGDLNSRVLKPETAEPRAQEGWLRNDELLSGGFDSLRVFQEGPIRFAPTFQYVPGTQKFGWKRHPAWCDRVLFKTSRGAELDLIEYDAFHEIIHTSDHRPVAAQLTVTRPN
jgi:endonuclease/exonuclease/phosphatase family metal-dependent hydrolase